MALVVVGGQSRNVGKTNVIAGLISALASLNWTAVKITPHEHGLSPDQNFAVSEESKRTGSKDTSRYLAAGARRALLVQARPGAVQEAMSAVLRQLASAGNAIVESNAVMDFVRPDLYLIVLDPGVADFKESAGQHLSQADAIIATEGSFPEDIAALIAGKPVFRVNPQGSVPADLVEFVRGGIERRD